MRRATGTTHRRPTTRKPSPPGVSLQAALQSAKDALYRESLDAIKRYGSTTAAAAALGIPRTTLHDRAKAYTRRSKQRTGANQAVPLDLDILDRLARAETQAAEERAARETLESLHLQRRETRPAWGTGQLSPSAPESLTPILFTSDFQVGEVIEPDEIDGLNTYNQDVFRERYELLIEKTIVLARQHTGAKNFPGIIYLRGGDSISGEIHEDLAETNDLSAIPACRLLHQYEREGIRRLKTAFRKVRVISIPGNHGRHTKKPRTKSYAAKNFETLLGWWLASSFDSDPAISFWQPPSGDASFEVEGWRFLLSHGDRMGSKGGQGFIGPVATIARGHQKLYSNYAATGLQVDCILTGHLHTSMKLERGYANGSLAGYSELARDIRALPAPAKQWLLFAHREHQISHAFEVILSPWPRRREGEEVKS